MSTKNLAKGLTLMKLAKSFFAPILEVRDLIKEASGEKINFLSMQERQEIVEDPEIDRIEAVGFSSASVRSKLKYSTFVPIYLQLYYFGDAKFREQYVEVCESNIGENAFQILEKRNSDYDRNELKEILEMYNCKEMAFSVGTRIQGPYSIGDLISGINNVWIFQILVKSNACLSKITFC